EYLSPTRLPGTPAFNPSANRASDHKSPDALREIARPGINSERNYISASLLRQPGINLIGLQLQCLAQVRLGSRSQLAANERNRRGDLRVDGELAVLTLGLELLGAADGHRDAGHGDLHVGGTVAGGIRGAPLVDLGNFDGRANELAG